MTVGSPCLAGCCGSSHLCGSCLVSDVVTLVVAGVGPDVDDTYTMTWQSGSIWRSNCKTISPTISVYFSWDCAGGVWAQVMSLTRGDCVGAVLSSFGAFTSFTCTPLFTQSPRGSGTMTITE